MKLIIKLLSLLLIGLVALVGAGYILVPPAAKTAVDQGSLFAFGVPATIGGVSASLGISSTDVGFTEYVLSSPEGFDDPLLSIGRFDLGLQTASLMGDVKVVDEFVLEDVTLTLSQRGTSNNLVPVLQHLLGLAEPGAEAGQGQGDDPDPQEPEREGAPGPKVQIRTVRFSGIAARLQLSGIPGLEEVDQRFEIPPYERDWSKITGAEGMTVAQIAGLALRDLEQTVLDAADGRVPAPVLAALRSTLEGGLDGGLDGAIDAGKAALQSEVDKGTKELEDKAQQEVDKAAGKAQEELQKGLRGLLPGGGQ